MLHDPIDHKQDIDCWLAFIQGNRDALGLLFRRHYADLFRYGNKICADTEILEDCIQELFIELWQSKNAPPSISVKAYLLKAIKYKLLKALHKRSNTRLQATLPEDIIFEISYETFIIDKQEHAERTSSVLRALEQLSARQKEIIYLKFYQNLSYEEVSDIMNINYQVARNLLSQAIKTMKKILQKLPLLLFA
ncbi:sigma-70 family RNA polymerase sigma factor [Pseudoflavitalea sp. X16]|uniref:RNA polymerase sigma factor n=1 Tax=Paraflavitalea devenefica TaxID=2716334 RepID=UPI00141EB9C3|nr:sigma-70 family RNA polymerase sigma factor [Paraflavitalea devenefica]NII26691.1 sigma-70 family RNA polymerase sigma factor [Paraflavitalea devenefica]